MGKSVSKEQVVIAQSGGKVTDVESSSMSQQNILLIVITAMLLVIVVYFMWSQFKSRIKRWLRHQIAGNTRYPHGMVLTSMAPPPASAHAPQPAAPGVAHAAHLAPAAMSVV